MWVAVGASDGSVKLWETATGLMLADLKCPQAAALSDILLSPDARLLAVVVDASVSADVFVFDVPSTTLLASFVLRGSLSALRWSAGPVLQDAQGDLCASFTDLYLRHVTSTTQQLFAEPHGSVERKAAALKILQLKGLFKHNNESLKSFSALRSLLYTAIADGWSSEDTQVDCS